ncbi:hypothetical protein SDC9_149464 [bioreactor metagenome]|uniref:Uncharacterized protein n=1 Tax=bioreactor metagenome TaxID=1076179 RepID=A0A645ELM5_9ZZZZ
MFHRNVFVAGFICAIGEDAGYIYIICVLLEEIVVFDRHLNALNSKEGRILLVFGFLDVVLQDVLGYIFHPLIRHPHFVCIDAGYSFLIFFIKLPAESTDVFHREAQHVFVSDSVFDQVMMQAFLENICCHSAILAWILRKSRCSCKTKVLSILEMLMNQFMHFPELGTVAFIDDGPDLRNKISCFFRGVKVIYAPVGLIDFPCYQVGVKQLPDDRGGCAFSHLQYGGEAFLRNTVIVGDQHYERKLPHCYMEFFQFPRVEAVCVSAYDIHVPSQIVHRQRVHGRFLVA